MTAALLAAEARDVDDAIQRRADLIVGLVLLSAAPSPALPRLLHNNVAVPRSVFLRVVCGAGLLVNGRARG